MTGSTPYQSDTEMIVGLTNRERRILGMIAAGCPYKAVAADLGIALATVATYVRRARAKTGAQSTMELIAMFSSLERASAEPTATLTSSEREILLLMQRGAGRDEIARLRQRSVRTVANQMFSVRKKTGASSRALVCGSTPRQRAENDCERPAPRSSLALSLPHNGDGE